MGKYNLKVHELYFGDLPQMRCNSPQFNFQLPFSIVTLGNYAYYLKALQDSPKCSLDTETTGLEFSTLECVSLQFCTGKENFIIFSKHNKAECLPRPLVQEFLEAMKNKELIYTWNFFFDARVIQKEFDFDVYAISKAWCDCSELVFLIDTNFPFPKLKWAENYFLGLNPPTFIEMMEAAGIELPTNKGGTKIIDPTIGDAAKDTDPKIFAYYSCYDSFGTYSLGELLYPVLLRQYPLIVEMDRRFLPALMQIEDEELQVNEEKVRTNVEKLGKRIQELLQLFHDHYDPEWALNINSKKHLLELFKKKRIDTGALTPGGKNGDKKQMSLALKVISVDKFKDIELIQIIVQYSRAIKQMNSYFQPLMDRVVNKLPMKIHYNNKKASTYRLSAGGYNTKAKKAMKNKGMFLGINLQSSPKPKQITRRFFMDFNNLKVVWDECGQYEMETGDPKLNFRACFDVNDDELWVSMDYSGEEIIFVTELSREPVWIDAIQGKKDIHMETAKRVWGPDADKNKRKLAKSVTFTKMFGGTAYALMKNLGIPEDEANKIMADYDAALISLNKWQSDQKLYARQHGSIYNMFGLPRRLRAFYIQGKGPAMFADRTALNFPIQSTGGVIIRLAILRIQKLIRDKYQGIARCVNTIHDELNFVVKKTHFLEFVKEAKETMESVWPAKCLLRLEAGVSIGHNWGELVDIQLDPSAPHGFVIAANKLDIEVPEEFRDDEETSDFKVEESTEDFIDRAIVDAEVLPSDDETAEEEKSLV